jgi:hypothetical protein
MERGFNLQNVYTEAQVMSSIQFTYLTFFFFDEPLGLFKMPALLV